MSVADTRLPSVGCPGETQWPSTGSERACDGRSGPRAGAGEGRPQRRLCGRSGASEVGVWLSLLAALVSTACVRRDISPPPLDPIVMARETYAIGVGDVLGVSVWKNKEVGLNRVPVRSDGMISVPLLDDVQAEGLQPMELKEVITRELSEYINNPNVTVTVLDSSRSVSIMGEVRRNTRIPLNRHFRVLEVIAAAGGFTNFADKSDIRIVRRHDDGSETEYRFDYSAYVKGNAAGTNIVLQPGDMIIVPD